MKIIAVISILTVALVVSGCTDTGQLEQKAKGQLCSNDFQCSGIDCGSDLGECVNDKCACPEPDALDTAFDSVFCNKGPHNEIWSQGSAQSTGFYLNPETDECEYYDGIGGGNLFYTLEECEFACK